MFQVYSKSFLLKITILNWKKFRLCSKCKEIYFLNKYYPKYPSNRDWIRLEAFTFFPFSSKFETFCLNISVSVIEGLLHTWDYEEENSIRKRLLRFLFFACLLRLFFLNKKGKAKNIHIFIKNYVLSFVLAVALCAHLYLKVC